METRQSRFDAHPIHAVLVELDRQLGELLTTTPDDFHDRLEDLAHAVAYAQGALASADPSLVPLRPLDAMRARVEEATGSVESFRQSADTTHLDSALISLDSAIEEAAGLPNAEHPDIDQMRRDAVRYRQSIAQLKAHVAEQVKDAQQDVGILNDQLAALGAGIRESTATAAGQIEAELAPLATRVAETTTAVDAQKARLDAAIATFQAQFSEAEAKRVADFGTTMDKARTDLDAALKEVNDALHDDKLAYESEAGSLLLALRGHEATARGLVSSTAAESISRGYREDADDEGKAANRWRTVGIASLLGTAAFGAIAYADPSNVTFDIHWLAGRLLFAIPLFGVAIYAFAQSAGHRKAEREARSLDLDFKALEPYIEFFSAEQKHALKTELAQRAFFGARGPDRGKDPGWMPSPKDIVDILKEAVKK